MGYDMSIKGTITASDPEEVKQAQDAYRAAAEAHRDRMDADRAANAFTWDRSDESAKESNELFGKYIALASPGDFRLNIFGMSRYRGAMFEIGMVHESTDPSTRDDW